MNENQSSIHRVANELAKQNKVVNRTVDNMVEFVSSQPDFELRSDSHEINKTSELIVLQDLLLGESEEVPTPRPKQRTEPKGKLDKRDSDHRIS